MRTNTQEYLTQMRFLYSQQVQEKNGSQFLAEEFTALAHEVADELMHRDERRSSTTKRVRETEAEAVAFVVCSAIGLETASAAQDYIGL